MVSKQADIRPTKKGETKMLSWALFFFVIAIVAAFFGFGGIAGTAASIAQLLFIVFVVLFLAALIFGRRATDL